MMAEFSGGSDQDRPPYSRLFIACGKGHTEEQLREAFSQYGEIESLYVVKDTKTKESKGVAYVKFSSTSSAARAQENVDKTRLGHGERPIAVCIAASKTTQKSFDINEFSARNRLYVSVPIGSGDEELKEEFSRFDGYESCHLVRGGRAAFVTFSKPSAAALAMEGCKTAYRPVIAEPRDTSKVGPRSPVPGKPIGSGGGRAGGLLATPVEQHQQLYHQSPPSQVLLAAGMPGMPPQADPYGMGPAQAPGCLAIKADCSATPAQLKKLCDVPPGLVACTVVQPGDGQDNAITVFAVYHSTAAAQYASSKLSELEYPPGSPLQVSFADHGSPSDSLPRHHHSGSGQTGQQPGPGASRDPSRSSVSSLPNRAFFVCNPAAPPLATLQAAFAQFGNLGRIWLVGDHNYGYAEFASVGSAILAISQLNGTLIGGSQVKVVHAEPRKQKEGSSQGARRSA